MNYKFFGSLLIVLIMIGSMFAIVLNLSNNLNDNSGDSVSDDNQEPVEPVINYTATVDANVSRLLSSVRVSAEARALTLSEIISSLREIKGVTNVVDAGFISSTGQTLEKVPFVATLVVSDDFNYDSILYELREKRGYDAVFVYPRAILRVPESIELFNNDLNVSTSFSFSQPFVEGFVNLGTIKGDRIRADLQLALRGKQLVNVFALEKQNYSQQILSHSETAFYKIGRVLPSMVFSGKINYNGFDLNDFEKKFYSVEDVNSARVELAGFSPVITVVFNKREVTGFEGDLNAFFREVKGKLESDLNLDSNFLVDGNNVSVKIPVLNEFDFAEKRLPVLNVFRFFVDQNQLSDFVLMDNPATLQGQIIFSGSDSNRVALEVEKILSLNDTPLKVSQVAVIDTNTVRDEKTGEEFVLQNEMRALLFPGHKVGDKARLKVSFLSQRKEAFFAQAEELKSS